MNDTTQTPAADAGATPAAAAKREQIAEHAYLDANGAVQENIEHAAGIRYVDKATGKSFDYLIPGAVAGSVATMLAIFGAKTKATNAASAARQARKRDAQFTTDDVDYIAEIFGEIKDGQWEKPSDGTKREPKYDLDVLTQVIVDVLAKAGKSQDPLKMRERLESDLAFRRGALSRSDIRDEYNSRVGKTEKPLDDLLVE